MTPEQKPEKDKPEKLAEWKEELPLIPLRNMVVFPQMIVPLFIGRSRSIKALEDVMEKEKMVVFVTQKSEEIEEPSVKDLVSIGTLSEIVQLLSLPDGTTKILVEGIARVKVEKVVQEAPYFRAKITRIVEPEGLTVEAEALVRSVIKNFETYVKLNKRIPPETLMSIINVDHPGRLADLITSYLTLKVEDKQSILESVQIEKRLKKLLDIIEKEVEILEVEKKLQGKVRKQIEKVQKEYYLKEKLRAIQEELGEEVEDESEIDMPELNEYKKKIESAKLPAEVKEKAEKELERLKKMPSMVAEATVIRTYLDWLVELPWKKKTKSKFDINDVKKILNEDHFGLEKVKERIIEYFAVLQLTGKIGSTILCLVGPPGVGKTSVASSIARSMGRKFVRVALGGVRDEAEIRGHRRTYVGAMPGRVVQSIHKVGVSNPVFLLDEIDKLGADFRGDPASALLEVLDPEQNKNFADHYLEVPFDLSDVFFITTANQQEPIPRPLRDRMEIIEMSGYTEEEKLNIAKGYLIPKELEKHGLKKEQVDLTDEAVTFIIQEYTREAGVRNLERSIATILRKIATEIVASGEKKEKTVVKRAQTEKYLGAPKYRYGLAEETDVVGVATGLAWTEVGGDTIPVEVTTMKGRGSLTITGQLGDVMQESAKAAMSYVRSKAEELGLEADFYRKYDIHIHVPEGAVPKDGPSAGITIATALTSAISGIAIRKDVAMTGEVTLRGKVLPIGGIKEKFLAARRAGITNIILPFDNKKDLDEIRKELPADLKFYPVKEMDEVLKIALVKSPISEKGKKPEEKSSPSRKSPQPPIEGQMFA
ncbi:MAG TPA: endopeptidase La [Candidatus Omnitrophota bacterium]|nr:endopeptidase La [Candidatus Omnitrophota bacterium]